jgi:hypothetical protein
MKEIFPNQSNSESKKEERELQAVEQTPYGPRLERRPVDNNETSKDVDDFDDIQTALEHEGEQAAVLAAKEKEGWLDEEQTEDLRSTLKKVLKGAVLAGAVITGAEVGKRIDTDQETDKQAYDNNPTTEVAPSKVNQESPEVLIKKVSAEQEKELSRFEREVLERQQALKPEDIAETYELALQPAEGTDGLARMEFIQKAYVFDEEQAKERGWSTVPSVVWDELAKIVPGWVGQESRFDENSVSSSEAKGPWQYLPIGWKDVRGDTDISTRFDEQVEASKDTVVKNYKYIHHYAGAKEMEILQSKFDSEEEYLRDFLAKVLLAAHNAGGKLIGTTLNKFVADVSVEEMKSGKELFLQYMDYSVTDENGDFAKYNKREQEEKRGYVPQIYALGNALKQKQT